MSKNLLITGGCGFIGSNYINHIFYQNQYDLICNIDALYYCSDINNIHKKIKQSTKYKFYEGNICDYKLLQKIIQENNITHIIHFAAQSHVDNSFNESIKYTNDNVLGTHNILEVIKNTNRNVVMIHFSTDEVYGESDIDDIEKTEESILCPTNPYAASKAAAEMYVRSYIFSFNLKIIITRGNNIFGKNQYPEKLIPKFIKCLKEGKKCTIHGDGSSIRNFIHIDDVCNALDIITENGSFGQIYNIGNDITGEKSVLDVTKYLIKMIKNTEDVNNYIEYVNDRPFNDKRYLISNKKLKELGWEIKGNFYDEMNKLINDYISNEEYYFIIYLKNKNNKWLEYYKEIRKHTLSNIIFIAFEDFKNTSNMNLVNTTILINEFDFNNNLISYYYFYVNKYANKAIFIDDSFPIDKITDCINLVQKEDNIILSKKEKIENLNEKNMLESIINDFDIKFKNEIMLKYKNSNWNGSNRLLTILSYNKIKYFQEKFDIFKYLKNLDYTNFSYLENIFGFLLSL
jgi:dTDP-glucose 4,6-dehydratase